MGIDYSGAIHLSHGDEPIKVYVCLFTCANTRAVHLELAEDLSVETFLTLLRRFIARHSCPKIIISDNAMKFNANADYLASMANDPVFEEMITKLNIRWKFMPPGHLGSVGFMSD